MRNTMRTFLCVLGLLFGLLGGVPSLQAAPRVYVILWFDTEDYILPASDDAALQVADLLTRLGVKATFKVVGEKARTLERRKRDDVIAATEKHEIGYHSAWHSVQPSPALYLSNLGWDEGVTEFDRREGPGRTDVERIFGVAPSCYGQPGSSWASQSYGAMQRWGMPVYLDAGSHVNLDNKPCYYCGALNLYKLEHTLRADLDSVKKLDVAQEKFLNAHKQLLSEGGGVISVYYHPCEFVHKEFWDGVNFRKGRNPPREQWKLPAMKTPEETKTAFEVLSKYVQLMRRCPEVQFITASEAARLYRDQAQKREYTKADLKAIATAVTDDVNFQQHSGFTLSASEVFLLLNSAVNEYAEKKQLPEKLSFKGTPFGPTGTVSPLTDTVTTDWSQFHRTSTDVADFLRQQKRIPSAVWLGSTPVPPEAYLRSLAEVVLGLLDGKEPGEKIVVKPARLAVSKYVSDDDPKLWSWVIFPPGFRAPALMELARLQSWTLKPALLTQE